MSDDKKTKDVKAADDVKADADTAAPAADASDADTAGGEPKTAGTDQYGRQLYTVTCSNCSKDTQVPFKPSGDRPVYCRDCYMQQRRERRGGGFRQDNRR